jgi:hypothetical protein
MTNDISFFVFYKSFVAYLDRKKLGEKGLVNKLSQKTYQI